MFSVVPVHSSSMAGRNVVVIGGNSGIGYSVAKAATIAGANVHFSATSQTKIDKTLTRIHAEVPSMSSELTGAVINVLSDESITAFFAALNGRAIDHLVYTAGDALAMTADLDVSKAHHAFDVRYWSVFNVVRLAQPQMRSHFESSITLTSGILARHILPGFMVGGAVNAATESAARYLSQQLAPIRVNAISFGIVATEMWDNMMPKEAQQAFFKQEAEKRLVKHIASADEVAEAYVFCWRCRYLTGQCIDVDGGSITV